MVPAANIRFLRADQREVPLQYVRLKRVSQDVLDWILHDLLVHYYNYFPCFADLNLLVNYYNYCSIIVVENY